MIEHSGVRSIRDSEHPACLEMLGRAFSGDGSGYFVRYFEGDPYYKNDYCRVYVEDGRVVSSLHICRREVRVGRARLVMGGIANVGTDPDHRGKGHSSAVLRDSLRVMDDDGMDFSILYTGINEFYARLGWRTLPVPYLEGALKRPAATPAVARYQILPYDPDTDVPALLRVHEAFSDSMLMTAIRGEFLWRSFTMHRFHPPWQIRLARDGSGVVAYTMSKVDDGRLSFDELGFLPGHDAALGLLMRQAAEDAASKGAAQVRLEPATHPTVTAIASGIAEGLETHEGDHGMVAFFDLERTFRRLLPELDKRVRDAGLAGSATIETEVGDVAIACDGSGVALVPSDGVGDRAALTQPDLTRLVFGIGPARDAESRLTEGAKALLDRLFPPRPFVYWQADKF